jgi:periplasmic protein TonB
MFEQSLVESACLAKSHRALTTSLSALAQLALLGIAILLPVVFTQNLPLLRPQAVMPMPRIAPPPEPEPVIERDPTSSPASGNQAVVVQNVFPPVKPLPGTVSDNRESISVPSGFSTGPINYDLPIGTPNPTGSVRGPSMPVISTLDEGRIVRKIQPVYPESARRIRIEGEVVLEGVISSEGRMKDLKVISGHPWLAAAAQDAVSQWQFRPYVLNGKPIDVLTHVKVDFKLNR